jgi:hypothetical protein
VNPSEPAAPETAVSETAGEVQVRLLRDIGAWPIREGVRSTDLTALDEPLRSALNAAVRQGQTTLRVFAGGLGLNPEQAQSVLELLLSRGALRLSGAEPEPSYQVRLARSGRSGGELWQRVSTALDRRLVGGDPDQTAEPPPAEPPADEHGPADQTDDRAC